MTDTKDTTATPVAAPVATTPIATTFEKTIGNKADEATPSPVEKRDIITPTPATPEKSEEKKTVATPETDFKQKKGNESQDITAETSKSPKTPRTPKASAKSPKQQQKAKTTNVVTEKKVVDAAPSNNEQLIQQAPVLPQSTAEAEETTVKIKKNGKKNSKPTPNRGVKSPVAVTPVDSAAASVATTTSSSIVETPITTVPPIKIKFSKQKIANVVAAKPATVTEVVATPVLKIKASTQPIIAVSAATGAPAPTPAEKKAKKLTVAKKTAAVTSTLPTAAADTANTAPVTKGRSTRIPAAKTIAKSPKISPPAPDADDSAPVSHKDTTKTTKKNDTTRTKVVKKGDPAGTKQDTMTISVPASDATTAAATPRFTTKRNQPKQQQTDVPPASRPTSQQTHTGTHVSTHTSRGRTYTTTTTQVCKYHATPQGCTNPNCDRLPCNQKNQSKQSQAQPQPQQQQRQSKVSDRSKITPIASKPATQPQPPQTQPKTRQQTQPRAPNVLYSPMTPSISEIPSLDTYHKLLAILRADPKYVIIHTSCATVKSKEDGIPTTAGHFTIEINHLNKPLIQVQSTSVQFGNQPTRWGDLMTIKHALDALFANVDQENSNISAVNSLPNASSSPEITLNGKQIVIISSASADGLNQFILPWNQKDDFFTFSHDIRKLVPDYQDYNRRAFENYNSEHIMLFKTLFPEVGDKLEVCKQGVESTLKMKIPADAQSNILQFGIRRSSSTQVIDA